MTIKILTIDTKRVIHRSNVRLATDHASQNIRVTPLSGEEAPPIIKSRHDSDDGETKQLDMPVFNPDDIVGCTFLLNPQEDGQRHCAHNVRLIEDHEAGVK